MGSLSLLQGIFPTQELDRGLLHCRRILYQLSCQGRPSCYLTLRNELSQKTRADQAGDFTGKGWPGGQKKGGAPRGTALPRGWQSWDFLVMGLV